MPGGHGTVGAFGSVNDALTFRGNAYKLADSVINDIINVGTGTFDAMYDQEGFYTSSSTGNFEYIIIRDYTATFAWNGVVPESSTTTTMQSYRISDQALAWSGRLTCGGVGGFGINCQGIAAGPSTCNFNMGNAPLTSTPRLYFANTNGDSYMYMCNGNTPSSASTVNHRYCKLSTLLYTERGVFGIHCLTFYCRVPRAISLRRLLRRRKGQVTHLLYIYKYTM